MSAGIGMEVGQQEANFASQTASQMAEALINLLKALGKSNREHYSDDFDQGMKVISGHVKQHGTLRQSIFEEQDAALFANILRELHVPYMQFVVRTEGDKQQIVFLTRGGSEAGDRGIADDGPKLEKAWEMFVKKMMEQMQEINRDPMQQRNSRENREEEREM